MIRFEHWLEPVSFYLGLGLLLYSFKSIHCSPANPQWRSGIGDGCRHHAPGSILTLALLIFFLKNWRDSRSTFKIGAAQLRYVTEIAPKSPFLCANRSSIRNSCRVGPKAIQYTVNTARVKATMTMTKTGTTVQLATHCFSRALHFARLFWRSCYRQSYDVSRWIWILSARMCFSKSIKIWAFWKDICILFLCFCPLFSNNCTSLSLLDSLIYIMMLKTRWLLFFLSVNLKFSLIVHASNSSFYNFRWKRGWIWPCFDTTPLAFLCKSMLFFC